MNCKHLNSLFEVPGFIDGLANQGMVGMTTEEAMRLREALRANAEALRQGLTTLSQCQCGTCKD